jgi:hypothetical protein
MAEAGTVEVVAVFTVAAVEGSTGVVVECGRVAEVALVAGPFRLLLQGLVPGEALLLLVRGLGTALPGGKVIIFRGLAAAILQTGMSV